MIDNEKKNANNRRYYQRNKKEISEKAKIYYIKNKEKIIKKQKEYKKNNQEHLKEYRRGYNKINKVKRNEQNKIYYQQNKKYYNNYYLSKYRNDKKFNLTKKMYSIIRQCILKNKSGWAWETFVGYTIEDLILRLKNTLPEGYTWQNYLDGKLQLDHIIPISVFNFSETTDYEFQECWALENLRLVTPEENHSKGSKVLKAKCLPVLK